MANLFDYLKSRGHLPFEEAPFNEIDSLILSRLSYLPFDEIVPRSFTNTVTTAQASDLLFQSENAQERAIMRMDLPFLREVAASGRFAEMGLCGFTNQVDSDSEKQFAAMVIRISPQLSYVSFRGTDLSLAGWKEDFNMSFCTPVPSQREALHYLNEAAQNIHGEFMAGGHSKGGNLAVYASAFCKLKVQDRIVSVHNHDGPGFNPDVLESKGYKRISHRVKTFVPQSSVVGMLLQHEEDYYVIHSTQVGLMQHDLFSWEVVGDGFVYLDEVTTRSKFVDGTLKTWLSASSPEQREQFVDTLFAILEQTEATTLRELTTNWHKNAAIVLKSIREMDDDLRQNMSQALGLLLQAAKQTAKRDRPLSIPRPTLLLHRLPHETKKP